MTQQLHSGLDDFGTELSTEVRGSATAESVAEQMGNTMPELPRLKVLHGGAAMFNRKSDDLKIAKLFGVIVGATKHNTWYGGKTFDEWVQGEPAPCLSPDGVVVSTRSTDPQATGCAKCSRNRDAERNSAEREAAFKLPRKEACNNYLSIAMILKDMGEIPYLIQLSASSFKAWARFNQELYASGRFQPFEVVTEISLKNVTGQGKQYSEPLFKRVGQLPADRREVYAKLFTDYTSYMKRRLVTEREEEGSSAAADALARARAAEAAGAAQKVDI